MVRNHWVFWVELVKAGSPVPSGTTSAAAGPAAASAAAQTSRMHSGFRSRLFTDPMLAAIAHLHIGGDPNTLSLIFPVRDPLLLQDDAR